MDHYVEIRLLPDPEFQETMLMNALFAKLHRALVSKGNGEIGISFPQVGKTLGDTMRLHGSRAALERMMELSWLKGVRDHTAVSEIVPIPEKCRFRVVKRVQAKSSVERLYRRSVKKGWITAAEAEKQVQKHRDERLSAPFIQMGSQSTGQRFRLFINHGEITSSPQGGAFSAYGLSGKATVPWF